MKIIISVSTTQYQTMTTPQDTDVMYVNIYKFQ